MLHSQKYINCNGSLLDLSTPKVMGILNATPDSFYDGNKHKDDFLKYTESMINNGADIIDIGSYSSRPNADDVSPSKEIERLNIVLDKIRTEMPDIILSVDTFRAEVAQFAVERYKVDIINDISGGELDKDMLDVAGGLRVPYIMMHMRGTPSTMQNMLEYNDISNDLIDYFAKKINIAKDKGINDIIIDPGFGFSKTLDQNYELLSNMDDFKILGLPILVGVSRKSMIYNLFNSSAKEALNGTSVINTIALNKGANILRVHDVKEAVECVKIFEKVKNPHTGIKQ